MNFKKQGDNIKEAIKIAKTDNDFKLIEEALIRLNNRVNQLDSLNGLHLNFNKNGSVKSIFRTYESENKLNKDLKRLIR